MIEVNVIGYGQMGRQIASLLCLLGCSVTVWNRHAPEQSQIAKQLKLSSKLLDMPITENTICVVDSLEELNKQAITIESVVEDLDVKKAIFKQCEGQFLNGYYTNSSSFTPDEIGNNVGGLHFFNPINLKLVEYCQPEIITDGINDLLNLLKQQQFHVAYVHTNRGYIANSILLREVANVFMLIEQYHYAFAEIENVYHALGRNNIFDMVDLIGVDTAYTILKNINDQDKSVYLPLYLQTAIDNGILGRKNKTSIRRFLTEVKMTNTN